ncbi:MAG: PhoH family protein [Bacteroidetes bacterium]|jgi:PhoH-like ATPase|nr:PhoH family protein [Bacteroidota bacterium]
MSRKKIYVLDTSVYLTNADCIYAFKNHDIIIPLKVFEEVDKHKKRQDAVGAQARKIIRIWDDLRQKGSIHKGVRIEKGLGMVRSISAGDISPTDLPRDLDIRVPDHLIIATAFKLQKESDKKVILVSRDINMRVIADAIGLVSEDFQNHQVVDNSDNIYAGYSSVLVDDQVIDRFYEKRDIFLENSDLVLNQYVLLVSNANEKKTALGRFVNAATPIRQLQTPKKGIWGIKPRNKEQYFLMDALMNPEIELITAIGKAGSGKTVVALAAALQQTLEPTSEHYSRIIVSRPVQPLGKEIGFLPGEINEKMSPWLMPIQDNLQFLMGNDKVTLDMYLQAGTIEIEALTYIRGRSIANAFIIIDECQNLSMHEIKTIITRIGEGTKIVLIGDVEQIDNIYVNSTTNGLTHAVEKFKNFELAAHITLNKGERSRVASYAAEHL